MNARLSQEQRILNLLESAWPSWTPAPALSRISLGYGRCIHTLRRRGWLITNRVEIIDGVRHGSFRLGSRPVPRSSVLRARNEAAIQQNLIERPDEVFDAAGRYPD